MNLVVSQKGNRIGLLCGTEDRGVTFRYDYKYLGTPDARPLSHSLPLQSEEFSSKACLPFFSGLLPDGELKRKISEFLHVSESSSLKLLEALGKECAGSVTLVNEKEYKEDLESFVPLPFTTQYRRIEDSELAALIKRMDKRPLLVGVSDARVSLAGAQQKIPLARFNGVWYIPLSGAPSTHILKPSRHPFPDLAVNEYLCMQVASLCGLSVPHTELMMLESTPVFIIERYDRKIRSLDPPCIERIQQEDACQALGIMPDCKYEADGGPGFREIVSLVQDISSAPIIDVRKLLDLAVFCFLIGNCDAHGKNISFLYPDQGSSLLSPSYDLVSTMAYEDLSSNLSMKIGGEYRIEHIRKEHFLRFGKEVGIGKRYMETLLDSMVSAIVKAFEAVALLPASPMKEPLFTTMRKQVDKRIRQLGK